ncbi:hypothetical protein GCM10020221_10920 [Streptomyces thioluteus]|uniref:Uncharacterized protein n=1 Tax=Streptomyces thioluteus TaxID=66431 RepID=A0ABN3WHZ1_STRTU
MTVLPRPPLQLDLELPLTGILVHPLTDLEAEPAALPVVVEGAQAGGVVVDGVVAEGPPPADGQCPEGAVGPPGPGEALRDPQEGVHGHEIAAVEADEQPGAFVDLGEGDGRGGTRGLGDGLHGRRAHTGSATGAARRTGPGSTAGRGPAPGRGSR